MEKAARINLRVTAAEKEAWEKAAEGSVSEWLRSIANEAAHPTDPAALVYRKVEARKKRQEAQCPRWMHHRPGVFCGSCEN